MISLEEYRNLPYEDNVDVTVSDAVYKAVRGPCLGPCPGSYT